MLPSCILLFSKVICPDRSVWHPNRFHRHPDRYMYNVVMAPRCTQTDFTGAKIDI